jgi:hypothetical protein
VTADPYCDSIHIAAEPDLAFDYFTNATALVRWMGNRAVVDPRPGGQFTLFFGAAESRGATWNWTVPGGWSSPGPGRLGELPARGKRPESHLTARDGGTLVAITHSGLPGGERPRHAAGWRHYLAPCRRERHGTARGTRCNRPGSRVAAGIATGRPCQDPWTGPGSVRQRMRAS